MARKAALARTPRLKAKRPSIADIYQFRITLNETKPAVWRRIQVPEAYSFWDLHVAIQDAMGWQDCHLHEFRVAGRSREDETLIGIPDPEFPEERPCLAGWKIHVSEHFRQAGATALYVYDFGDSWEHTITYEGLAPPDGPASYPWCVDGAGACPPEDCGGAGGYEEFLLAIRNPRHPEHSAMLEWIGGTFDPYAFDPRAVLFDDPAQRWRIAFEDEHAR